VKVVVLHKEEGTRINCPRSQGQSFRNAVERRESKREKATATKR